MFQPVAVCSHVVQGKEILGIGSKEYREAAFECSAISRTQNKISDGGEGAGGHWAAMRSLQTMRSTQLNLDK